jgi:hypothetical protein
MLQLEMDLLRKEIMLVDEEIAEVDAMGLKKSIVGLDLRKKEENVNNLPEVRSPKWLSYDRVRKSPRRHIFCYKTKSNSKGIKNTRPSMFGKLKNPNPPLINSPTLESCQSENKYLTKYSYLQNEVDGS